MQILMFQKSPMFALLAVHFCPSGQSCRSGLHIEPASVMQVAEQPSPSSLLPSSQVSPSSTVPSPQSEPVVSVVVVGSLVVVPVSLSEPELESEVEVEVEVSPLVEVLLVEAVVVPLSESESESPLPSVQPTSRQAEAVRERRVEANLRDKDVIIGGSGVVVVGNPSLKSHPCRPIEFTLAVKEVARQPRASA